MGGRPRALDQGMLPAAPKRYVTLGVSRPRDIWRHALRQAVGPDGGLIWSTLLSIMQGQAWVPKLADGREGPPQIPSTKDRIEAAQYVANALFGRPVDQSQIVEAEKAAQENAALSAMTDHDLLLEARRVLAELPPGELAELPPGEKDEDL